MRPLQERLLSLIAGHLLDVNSHEGFSEAQQANMTRNIADAVELLPKLTTGIDVDIMFDDINGFKVISSMHCYTAPTLWHERHQMLLAPSTGALHARHAVHMME